mmetsp:Transcript_70294/g.86258  ORF Transcript_70294/g.86258 Transcript_70294/m.86258 type:complete len:214 (-) Transcript_70294:929-1570(-)
MRRTPWAAFSKYFAPSRTFALPLLRSQAASILASLTTLRKSAQQKLSLVCAASLTSGSIPSLPKSSRAPASSLMYFCRIACFSLGVGNLVFSQSSMRPLRSNMSAIQWTFCPVKITTTSPFSRCRFPREVKPSIRPNRKRKTSEPRCPSSGRQPPITMSASSMNTTAGAAACAAAKTLMMSACSIISRTRKNFPLRRFASHRPTVVFPVPGCP